MITNYDKVKIETMADSFRYVAEGLPPTKKNFQSAKEDLEIQLNETSESEREMIIKSLETTYYSRKRDTLIHSGITIGVGILAFGLGMLFAGGSSGGASSSREHYEDDDIDYSKYW